MYMVGLLCGVTPYLIAVLCENEMNGGGGYTPAEVGAMTLDQIFMRLADCKKLRHRHGRVKALPVAELSPGMRQGRTASGQRMQAEVRGISKVAAIRARNAAQRTLEAENAKKAKQDARRKRRQRR